MMALPPIGRATKDRPRCSRASDSLRRAFDEAIALLALLQVMIALVLASPSSLNAQHQAYVASSKGVAYYWSSCKAASRLSPANRIYFPTRQAAEAAGFRPSKSRGCAGPEYDAMVITADDTDERCAVEKVIDGDSFHCSRFGSIRLLLIDTPEPKQEPYGAVAKRYAESLLIIGDSVRVEFDVQRRDKYGRVLAYVFDGRGRMVNRELARAGVAVLSIYPPNVKYVDAIRAAVDSARAEKLELWSGSAFDCLPADFRAKRCR